MTATTVPSQWVRGLLFLRVLQAWLRNSAAATPKNCSDQQASSTPSSNRAIEPIPGNFFRSSATALHQVISRQARNETSFSPAKVLRRTANGTTSGNFLQGLIALTTSLRVDLGIIFHPFAGLEAAVSAVFSAWCQGILHRLIVRTESASRRVGPNSSAAKISEKTFWNRSRVRPRSSSFSPVPGL